MSALGGQAEGQRLAPSPISGTDPLRTSNQSAMLRDVPEAQLNRRQFAVAGLATMLAAYLGVAALQLGYLALGYTIRFRSELGIGVQHVSFPGWRSTISMALAATASLTVILRLRGIGTSVWLAWVTLTCALVTGGYDVYRWGTMGSPTRPEAIGLLLGIALLAAN
ncbi:hypothetical protein, partial [Caulobacter sp. UNC279MFTsu5.1]|uniref:hypothetical protein n=1 Tax=Caulobacter sp. UNC279MFTsu5.1 TaxID=1502775 RepID=UPI001C42EC63